MMETLLSSASVASGTYFNVSLIFVLRSCLPPPQSVSEEDEVITEDSDSSEFAELPYLSEVKNWLFGGNGVETDKKDYFHWEGSGESDDCQDIIHTNLGGSVAAVFFAKAVFCVLLGLCLTLMILRKVRKKLTGQKEELDNTVIKTKEALDKDDKMHEDQTEVKSVGAVDQEQETDVVTVNAAPFGPKPDLPILIPLSNTGIATQNLDSSCFVARPDSTQFLTYTVDHLLAQLDWVLGLAAVDQPSANEPMSSTAASLVTPRLQRKGSMRRPRWRTLVSLPLGAANMSADDKTTVRMWQKVEEMEKRMNWKQLDIGDLDINAVQDNRLSSVLQFYQQACPVPAEQWSASCLIVNYVLTLLEQELLAYSSDKTPLKILELRSFGSAANGTCIARADRFDVMLVVQPSSCSEMSVYHCGVCDDIPAGKLVLGMKEATPAVGRATSQLLQKDRVGDLFGMFLSQKAVVKSAHTMVSNALERLKLKNKLLLDRLSFSVHFAQYEDLKLSIETKMLNGLGLGLSKINVRLTPSLQVASQKSDPLPALYAVPPWHSIFNENADATRGRIQSRIMRNYNQGVPSDLLWQLNPSELTKSFMALASRKLSSAGVSGCQVMCQQILRALFSHSSKDTLLTMGEVHPCVLDTVVFFLLLESPPSSWTLANLPDRLSDCVHFLRSAVQSAWMPGFMVHNPHLMKQMPALQLLPLLTTGRQENILASVGPDATDTMLGFMDSRLQETGLRRCLKDDYSTEMWEYEFFIFG